MTVDLIPRVRNFSIHDETFATDSHDVEDDCVSPGNHRLLRFDMLTMNVGDSDAEIGRPEDHPDLFEHSDSHGHQQLKDFNEYELFDASGNKVGVGRKQAFCLMDSNQIPGHPDPAGTVQFDCNS